MPPSKRPTVGLPGLRVTEPPIYADEDAPPEAAKTPPEPDPLRSLWAAIEELKRDHGRLTTTVELNQTSTELRFTTLETKTAAQEQANAQILAGLAQLSAKIDGVAATRALPAGEIIDVGKPTERKGDILDRFWWWLTEAAYDPDDKSTWGPIDHISDFIFGPPKTKPKKKS